MSVARMLAKKKRPPSPISRKTGKAVRPKESYTRTTFDAKTGDPLIERVPARGRRRTTRRYGGSMGG